MPGPGDARPLDDVIPAVYDELRRLARRQLAGHQRGVLDTTALVHEAYLKLAGSDQVPLASRPQFLAIAARAMRQIVVDFARRRTAQKRGGRDHDLALTDHVIAVEAEAENLLALNDALTRLGEIEPRLIRVVECRFFAGLSEEETAAALDVSTRTVQRDWTRARGWLRTQL